MCFNLNDMSEVCGALQCSDKMVLLSIYPQHTQARSGGALLNNNLDTRDGDMRDVRCSNYHFDE